MGPQSGSAKTAALGSKSWWGFGLVLARVRVVGSWLRICSSMMQCGFICLGFGDAYTHICVYIYICKNVNIYIYLSLSLSGALGFRQNSTCKLSEMLGPFSGSQ